MTRPPDVARVEEVIAVVEGDAEGSAGCQFMAAHRAQPGRVKRRWPCRRLSRSRGDQRPLRPARVAESGL